VLEPRLTTSVGFGLSHKLIGLMAAAVMMSVGVAALYFSTQKVSEARATLRERAAVYAKVGSLQLRSAVALHDQDAAREVLGALAQDPLIDGIALFDSDGVLLHGEGRLSGDGTRARSGLAAPEVVHLAGRVLATAPVVAGKGANGTLVLELSTRSAAAPLDRWARAALLAGLSGLAAGTLAAWLIARSLARRVERLSLAATDVARGNFESFLSEEGPNDEIGVLTRHFNSMMGQVRHLLARSEASARDESARLERLMQKRTAELNLRNEDLRLVLDHVEQGFITIDRRAVVTGEHSRVVDGWLGPLRRGDALWDYLDQRAPGIGDKLDVGWTEVLEGLMPRELTLLQMPKSLCVADRHLRLDFQPIGDGEFEKCLVVISDVTATVARERSEQDGKDLLALTRRLVDDRASFVDFVAETRSLLLRIQSNQGDLKLLKRDIHTLKGNTAIYGLTALSSTCHDLESQLADGAGDAATLDRARLTEQWGHTEDKLRQLLGDRQRRQIEIDEAQHRALLTAIGRGVAGASLTRMVQSLTLESLESRLSRFGEQLAAAVQSLQKGEIEIVVEATNAYVSREQLADFWSVFPHVIRNAAAHGLESPDARARAGKSAKARFDLRAGVRGDSFYVELQDSGPGVDWERVRQLAEERGLPSHTPADLTNALFVDGISTERQVNEIAGRGVGLSAVRATCERSNGTIEVSSSSGRGATFRFCWPAKDFPSLTLVDWGAVS
jgi:HAMP domain-containing protein/HPt (histidine-containing phosphotransfer) domain-containing protein